MAAASVSSVASQYQQELSDKIEDIKQAAVHLQEQAPALVNDIPAKVEPYKQELIATIQATGDVATPPVAVLTTMMWTSMMLIGGTVATVISANVFAPIFSMAIGTFGALALALVGLPLIAYYRIKADVAEGVPESTTRFGLLSLALVEGLLVGYILADRYVSGAPVAALPVALTSILYQLASAQFGNNRQMLLGASAGAATLATLTVGLVLGSLTASYLLLTLLYGGAIAATLQYLFANVTNDSTPTHQYELGLFIAIQASYILVHALCGMSGSDYKAAQQH
ncbi:unnamed protein product, partial [Mesorhabditis spiculigera]